jgi:hypothetical protein
MVTEVVQSVQVFAKDTATFNSWIGMCVYWLPVLICAIGYTLRTINNAAKDVVSREENAKLQEEAKKIGNKVFHDYYPTDTVGTVIGRIIVTVLPVANFWAALVDLTPKFWCEVGRFLNRVFSQPLVPRYRNK